MTKHKSDTFALELKVLAEVLSRCEQVTRYDTPTEKQAWTLAHTLLDLAESFRAFLDHQLPRLRDERLTSDDLYETLLEIGEELRHIVYHVRDPEFYGYLRGPADVIDKENPQQ